VLAGLRYDKSLIIKVLKESDMLEESVIYQDIFQKGKQQGVEQGLREGVEQEARKVALRLLERRVGKLSLTVRRQIEQLTREQLEALCEALLDFQSKQDLTRWLRQDAPAH
jgi:predicted transposase YdaD